jgi:lipoate-protein ligase A
MRNEIKDLEGALAYAMARFRIDQTERNFQKMLDFAHNPEMSLDPAMLERVTCRAQTLLLEWFHDRKAVMGPNGLTKRR